MVTSIIHSPASSCSIKRRLLFKWKLPTWLVWSALQLIRLTECRRCRADLTFEWANCYPLWVTAECWLVGLEWLPWQRQVAGIAKFQDIYLVFILVFFISNYSIRFCCIFSTVFQHPLSSSFFSFSLCWYLLECSCFLFVCLRILMFDLKYWVHEVAFFGSSESWTSALILTNNRKNGRNE